MAFIILSGIIGAVFVGLLSEEFGGMLAGLFFGALIGLIISSEVTSNMDVEKLTYTSTRHEIVGASFGEDDEETVLLVSYEDGTVDSCKVKNVKLFDSNENYIIVKEYEAKGIMKIFWLGKTEYEVYCHVEGHHK